MDIVMTFIANHHGVQWKLCTQEHQLSVPMLHGRKGNFFSQSL